MTDPANSTASATLATLPAALNALLDEHAPLALVLDHEGVIQATGACAAALRGQRLTNLWSGEDAVRLGTWLAHCVQHSDSINFICRAAQAAGHLVHRARVQAMLGPGDSTSLLFTVHHAESPGLPGDLAGLDIRPDPTMPSAFIVDGRQLAERLHFAEYGARFATWEFDTARCVLLTGPNYNDLHGLPADTRELAMSDILAMIHADDHEGIKAAIACLVREPTPPQAMSFDARIKLPRGELRWIEARFAAVPGAAGAAPRLFGISIDISARKAMEASLRDSRAWLDLAMSSIGMVLWDRDLHTEHFRSSGNYGRVYGFEGERREWDYAEFMARVVTEDHAVMRCAFDATLQSGQEYAPQFRIALPDGSVR